MDLNTLFSFNESLAEIEITQFIKDLIGKMKEPQDFEEVFELGMDKIREYPSCELLARSVAILMEQLLIIYGINDRSVFQKKIDKIYDKLMNSNDVEFRNETILMRVPSVLEDKNYNKAETMINSLPDTPLDKRVWQAEVYLKQERFSEAEKIYEEKLLNLVMDINTVLWGLSLTSIHQKQSENSEFYITLFEKVIKLFDLPEYNIFTAQLEIAVAKKDSDKSMDLLKQLLNSVKTINEPSIHPFHLILEKNTEKLDDDSILPELLTNQVIKSIKNNPEFELIRNHSDYENLLLEFDK